MRSCYQVVVILVHLPDSVVVVVEVVVLVLRSRRMKTLWRNSTLLIANRKTTVLRGFSFAVRAVGLYACTYMFIFVSIYFSMYIWTYVGFLPSPSTLVIITEQFLSVAPNSILKPTSKGRTWYNTLVWKICFTKQFACQNEQIFSLSTEASDSQLASFGRTLSNFIVF